jgi:hypothetical protein
MQFCVCVCAARTRLEVCVRRPDVFNFRAQRAAVTAKWGSEFCILVHFQTEKASRTAEPMNSYFSFCSGGSDHDYTCIHTVLPIPKCI